MSGKLNGRLTERKVERLLATPEPCEPPEGLLERLRAEIPPLQTLGSSPLRSALEQRRARRFPASWLAAASIAFVLAGGTLAWRLWEREATLGRAAPSETSSRSLPAVPPAPKSAPAAAPDARSSLMGVQEVPASADREFAKDAAQPVEVDRLRAVAESAGPGLASGLAGGVAGGTAGGVEGGFVGGVASQRPSGPAEAPKSAPSAPAPSAPAAGAPATGATVSQDELERIPTARDPWASLKEVPGVLRDRARVGGNERGQQSAYTGPGEPADDKRGAATSKSRPAPPPPAPRQEERRASSPAPAPPPAPSRLAEAASPSQPLPSAASRGANTTSGFRPGRSDLPELEAGALEELKSESDLVAPQEPATARVEVVALPWHAGASRYVAGFAPGSAGRAKVAEAPALRFEPASVLRVRPIGGSWQAVGGWERIGAGAPPALFELELLPGTRGDAVVAYLRLPGRSRTLHLAELDQGWSGGTWELRVAVLQLELKAALRGKREGWTARQVGALLDSARRAAALRPGEPRSEEILTLAARLDEAERRRNVPRP